MKHKTPNRKHMEYWIYIVHSGICLFPGNLDFDFTTCGNHKQYPAICMPAFNSRFSGINHHVSRDRPPLALALQLARDPAALALLTDGFGALPCSGGQVHQDAMRVGALAVGICRRWCRIACTCFLHLNWKNVCVCVCVLQYIKSHVIFCVCTFIHVCV